MTTIQKYQFPRLHHGTRKRLPRKRHITWWHHRIRLAIALNAMTSLRVTKSTACASLSSWYICAVLDLAVCSIRQGSVNWLVCLYYGYSVMIHWGWSLPGCLSSSVIHLRAKLKRGRHWHDSPIHEGYTVPNVESQVLSSNIPCLRLL